MVKREKKKKMISFHLNKNPHSSPHLHPPLCLFSFSRIEKKKKKKKKKKKNNIIKKIKKKIKIKFIIIILIIINKQ